MTQQQGGQVDWALESAPDLGRAAYRARATCPHGTTEHTLFGRTAIVMNEGRALAMTHTIRTGCRCGPGTLAIDGRAVGWEEAT